MWKNKFCVICQTTHDVQTHFLGATIFDLKNCTKEATKQPELAASLCGPCHKNVHHRIGKKPNKTSNLSVIGDCFHAIEKAVF